MTDLKDFADLVPLDYGLSVAVTLRADGTPHATVVNAGVLPHPITGTDTLAFVSPSATVKLANLRANPTVALTVRGGWRWITAEGSAQLIGPDDPHPEIDDERRRLLVREIFAAAGVTHDWDTYGPVIEEKRGTAVLVAPVRIYSNPL
ncbi:pyridoxamine 5'-phosphate oxidase family protein [Nocardia mexicana]|uniref:PPOX class probable F420-dependent enzyme n=1 Tax=Nocardia mexicana TaxID=279262 RepID=A0A370GZS8_9NOCA|nr:pyridoxamine 5'-phosphate oxidase family protein [Nocardia mexicana]RDI49161.1 PPOX class probable F420-dependent enzyme [Nocardia mexicana]